MAYIFGPALAIITNKELTHDGAHGQVVQNDPVGVIMSKHQFLPCYNSLLTWSAVLSVLGAASRLASAVAFQGAGGEV